MSDIVANIYLNILRDGRPYKVENGIVFYRSWLCDEWFPSRVNGLIYGKKY